MTPFQRKVWHYMRAVWRVTGRWPAYHDAAAEVAKALKDRGPYPSHADAERAMVGTGTKGDQ